MTPASSASATARPCLITSAEWDLRASSPSGRIVAIAADRRGSGSTFACAPNVREAYLIGSKRLRAGHVRLLPHFHFVPNPEVAASFNHLVGGRDEGRWNCEAKCLGGLTIDDKLEVSRLLDWQI